MASGAPLRLACRLRSFGTRRASAAAPPQGRLFARQQHTVRTTPPAAAPRPRVFQPRQPLTTATQMTPKPPTPSPPSPAAAAQAAPEPAAAAAADHPTPSAPSDGPVDWSRSFHGLSSTAFDGTARAILLAPVDPADVEIKPDGIVYLPEIKYRRILNRAFGPGAWGLAPRGELEVSARTVSREYGLVVQGRLVSIARGEQQYFDPEGVPTATEGCKSNALMRCCKDLGVASELWDPVFIRRFMASHVREVWVEHQTTKKKRKMFLRKDVETVPYPFKAV